MGGLLPLVAEESARGDGAGSRLRLARAVRAEHVQMQPRPQVACIDHDLGTGSHAGDDVVLDGGTVRACEPIEFAREGLCWLLQRVVANARTEAGCREAAGRPSSV